MSARLPRLTPRALLEAPLRLAGELRRGRRLSRREWRRRTAELTAAARPLRAFSALSDREFAQLASVLGDYQGGVSTLLDSVRTFEELFDETAEDNALRCAVELGKHAIELVHSSIGVASNLQDQFERVASRLDEALVARKEFEGNMIVFRSLAVSFRIEAVRCDSEHRSIFTAVADDFANLEQQVAQTTSSAFAEIERLTSTTRNAAVSSEDDFRHRASIQRVERLRTDITRMEGAIRPCGEQARAAAGLITDVPTAMQAIVQDLQFQDIVRQKLEHVEEGLAALHDPSNRSFALFLRVSHLQSSQLAKARQQIEAAGQSLLTSVSRLEAQGQETETHLRQLEQSVLHELGSREFASSFATDLEHLTEVARSTEETHERITAQVDQVERIITFFTREIATQQHQVRLTALNAQIAAARLENGGALERLAQETSRVARTNAHVTDSLRTKLEETLAILREVRLEAARSLELLSAEKSALEERAAVIGEQICAFANKIESDTGSVMEDFHHAHRALQQLREGLTFPTHLEAAFAPLETVLAAHAGTALDEADERRLARCARTQTLLRGHAERYTMEDERATHAAALLPAAVLPATDLDSTDQPPRGPPPAASPTEPDDDDGIELF